MANYSLYLESGPRHRKTMVHVLDLLGCVAVGATTEVALAATPAAIRAYLRFLQHHGDSVDPNGPFETQIVEHITEGEWLGNGSPYLVFGPDLEPITGEEIEIYLERFQWLRTDLAQWTVNQTAEQLDASPAEGGRTARAILLHVLGEPVGGYLSAALGGATGFSHVAGATRRGEIGIAEGLLQIASMTAERVRATTLEERVAIRERPNGDRRTLRKALRRILEHDWEHLTELSRRPGGPFAIAAD